MGITIGRNWHLTSPRERTINGRRLTQADAEVLIRDDAAQKAGEIAAGRPNAIPGENNFTPTVADTGLTSKDIFEAHQIRCGGSLKR